ncbi:MAG TPA: NADH-ubiquinone oxidoreductase-F iron-sulfur binding region domain-containing protein [Candidatus Nanopelagicaceae bacterium]|nr:NADH-ubiquinone oxidoreductase-F iron-sulfur binding region domain-containing protein [Candidatus Nanopelagicaceae bacterium]
MSDVTVVYVPRDAASLSVGADDVAQLIQEEAGNRGLSVKIVRNGSRGALWLEPLVEVATPDGRVGYGPVGVGDVAALFESGFLTGGSHALSLGIVDDHPWFSAQSRLTFARVGVVDPLSVSDYEAHGGLVALRKALTMSPGAIVEEVTSSGLRGRGGAGFPAGIKWRAVLQAAGDQKYVCCNADEGDSGTFADRMLMEGDPFSLIEAMAIAGIAVGATKGLIYVRSEYPHAVATMRAAIVLANEFKILGADVLGSGKTFYLELRVGAGSYVCGEETAMLESLEGKRGVVRAKPPIPALEGLFGKPTIINNVMTLASVPWIISNGASKYEEFGTGRSRGTQVFQLAGNVAQGGIVELALGVSLRELVDGFGGGTRTGRPVKTAQVGGPLGSYLPLSSFDVSMDYESLIEIGGMLGHGGVVVFDDTVDMAAQARFAMSFCAEESCGKCTPCRIGSIRGVETIDKIVSGEKRGENLELLLDLCEVMTEGSLCAMGSLTPLPVRSAINHFPSDFGIEPILGGARDATS